MNDVGLCIELGVKDRVDLNFCAENKYTSLIDRKGKNFD